MALEAQDAALLPKLRQQHRFLFVNQPTVKLPATFKQEYTSSRYSETSRNLYSFLIDANSHKDFVRETNSATLSVPDLSIPVTLL